MQRGACMAVRLAWPCIPAWPSRMPDVQGRRKHMHPPYPIRAYAHGMTSMRCVTAFVCMPACMHAAVKGKQAASWTRHLLKHSKQARRWPPSASSKRDNWITTRPPRTLYNMQDSHATHAAGWQAAVWCCGQPPFTSWTLHACTCTHVCTVKLAYIVVMISCACMLSWQA